MVTITSKSEGETEALAQEIGRRLVPGDVIAFSGGLGAGKTCFVRGLARGLGLTNPVSSPTFALVNEYRGKSVTLCHFDLYRITDVDDLYSIGFFDYLDGQAVLAIEWSERFRDVLPQGTIDVKIERVDDSTREITVKGDGRFDDLRA